MATGNTKNAGKKAYHTRYKTNGVYAKNKRSKLEKQLKLQPNNDQVKLALKDIASYRRKAPKVPYWSHTMRKTAQMLKKVHGRFDSNIFHNDPKVAAAALAGLPSRTYQSKTATRKDSMFSIGARVGWVS